MTRKYFENWKSREQMMQNLSQGRYDYETGEYAVIDLVGFPTDDEILFAAYRTGDYTGDAIVIYERDGKLYEWTGGHCSCNGLEEQWKGEGRPVTWEALRMRFEDMNDDWGFLGKHNDETKRAFKDLVLEHLPS